MAKVIKRFGLSIVVIVATLLIFAIEITFKLQRNIIWYGFLILMIMGFVLYLNKSFLDMGQELMYDGLTKLRNHQQFWQDLLTNRSKGLSLILIDVDYFKDYNDDNGHQKGNLMLKSYGCLLAEYFKDTGLAYRYGAQQFAVILEDFNNVETLDLAKKLCKDISHNNNLNSVSVGVISSASGNKDIHEMYHHADDALFQAKQLKDTVINAGIFSNEYER